MIACRSDDIGSPVLLATMNPCLPLSSPPSSLFSACETRSFWRGIDTEKVGFESGPIGVTESSELDW